MSQPQVDPLIAMLGAAPCIEGLPDLLAGKWPPRDSLRLYLAVIMLKLPDEVVQFMRDCCGFLTVTRDEVRDLGGHNICGIPTQTVWGRGWLLFVPERMFANEAARRLPNLIAQAWVRTADPHLRGDAIRERAAEQLRRWKLDDVKDIPHLSEWAWRELEGEGKR